MKHLTLASLLLTAIFACAPLHGGTITGMEDPANFGDLNQNNTNCPNVSCGPTAAVNSFVFLQKSYPNIYTNPLVPAATPTMTFAQQEAAIANLLLMPQFMNCNCAGGGTFFVDFIIGKQTYLDQTDPGATTYAAQTLYGWNQIKTVPGRDTKPGYVSDSTAPTAQFLANELNAGEDVEILIEGGANHYLTLTKITFDTVAKTGSINYIDPATGAPGTSNITGVNGNGTLQTSYAGGSSITIAVGESPVPEPGTMMLCGGLLLLVLRARSSRAQREPVR